HAERVSAANFSAAERTDTLAVETNEIAWLFGPRATAHREDCRESPQMARRRTLRPADARARVGAELSRSHHPADRSLPAGRPERHHRPRRQPEDAGDPQADDRHRQS